MAKASTLWIPLSGTGEVSNDNEGITRITESGVTRITESGTTRVLEDTVIIPKDDTVWSESDT